MQAFKILPYHSRNHYSNKVFRITRSNFSKNCVNWLSNNLDLCRSIGGQINVL